MSRTALALLALPALAGCGIAARRVVHTPLTVSHPTYHSVSGRYSVRQVERAFADQGVHLRNVTRPGWRGLVAFLDGRPAHRIYVYVSIESCKCVLMPPIRDAHRTHHGNVEVLWRRAERPAVRAALRELR